MPLDFSTSKVGTVVVATLKGTIIAGADTETLKRNLQELLDAGETQIVLELSGVHYLDSTGIGMLLRAGAVARRKGAAIKLANLTKRIYEVLQIAPLSAAFAIFDNLEKAVQSFPSEGGGQATASDAGPKT